MSNRPTSWLSGPKQRWATRVEAQSTWPQQPSPWTTPATLSSPTVEHRPITWRPAAKWSASAGSRPWNWPKPRQRACRRSPVGRPHGQTTKKMKKQKVSCKRLYPDVCFYFLFFFAFLLLWLWADDSGDDFSPSSPPTAPGQGGGSQNSEVQSALRTLGSKVEDLSTCNDLISKHGSALQRSGFNRRSLSSSLTLSDLPSCVLGPGKQSHLFFPHKWTHTSQTYTI